MIYLFDELQTFTETVRHEAYRLLPEQRLEKSEIIALNVTATLV